MTEPVLYDTHMHTPLCKHAVGQPEAYAEAAQRKGLKGIIITCHNPAPDGWAPRVRMAMSEFDQYVAMVRRAREAWADRIDVRLGLESDYLPGMEAWLEELHAKAPLEYVLGSVHPHFSEYKTLYLHDRDVLGFQRSYFENLALAAETGLFDCLAHPDLVKNVFASQWNPVLLMDDIRASLDRIARTGVAMELNTSGLNKEIREMNPARAILDEMLMRQIPVVVGSDAHHPDRVGADFDAALDLLAEVGYSHVSVFLERRRRAIPIAEARSQPVII